MRKLRTLAALITALCCSIASAYDFEVDGIYYNYLSSTTVEVTYATNEEYTGKVAIPESVTYEGSTYSVTGIGREAFGECYYLTSISIPNSVTSIGDHAFAYCSELKEISIPNSVTSIGVFAFACCPLKEITIPNGVTRINNYLFNGCDHLVKVTIPEGVTSIGESAFSGCFSLQGITIPSSVTSIDDYAFSGSGLQEITMLITGASIGDGVFNSTPWWESQAEGVVYLGSMLYRYKGVMPSETSIDVKEGTTSIVDIAFSNCDGLKEITIPNSVTSIGDYAFESCSSLKEISIPNSVTSIGDGVFAECAELQEITIPSSVTSIGARAFYHCDSLAEVIISESITKISDEAFMYCSNIKKIVCNAITPPTCYYDTFTGINKEECVLMVPEGTVTLYKEAKRWKDFFFVENIPSAIEQVASPSDSKGDIYDLNGRLVRTQAEGVDGLMPGIYIKNGNKFVVK